MTEHIAALAQKMNIPVMFNPGPVTGVKPSDAMLQGLYLLTPNESEAEFLTGMAIRTRADAEAAASLLIAKGVQYVLLTMGEHGALLANRLGGIRHIPAYRVKAVDTVAAGDTFTGALAVRRALGDDLGEAAQFAAAASAIAVTRPGAMESIPTLQEVILFMKEHQL